MNRETLEAYVLAGIGMAKGIGELVLREILPHNFEYEVKPASIEVHEGDIIEETEVA